MYAWPASPIRVEQFDLFYLDIINTSYQKLPFGSGDDPDKVIDTSYDVPGVMINQVRTICNWCSVCSVYICSTYGH